MLRLRTVWLGLLLALGMAGPAGAHHIPGPIRLVAVLSTSGSAGPVGLQELRALQLGVAELNTAGGILGHIFELRDANDEGDPKKAAEMALQLATSPQADFMLGGTTSETSLAIASVAEKLKIPYIALGTLRKVAFPTRRWVFKTPPSEAQAVLAVIADMGKRGVTRIALLYEADEFGEAGRRELQTITDRRSLAFKKFHIGLSAQLAYRPDPANIAAQVARVAPGTDSDAALVFGASGGAAMVIGELRRAGWTRPIYHSQGAVGGDFLKLAGSAAEGVRVPASPLLAAMKLPADDARTALLKSFTTRYVERYGEAPCSFSGYAYDALMLAVEAMKRATTFEEEWIRTALENITGFAGLSGTYNFHVSEHAGLGDNGLVLLEVRGGEWQTVE